MALRIAITPTNAGVQRRRRSAGKFSARHPWTPDFM
jgi:hypothetical protein